MHWKMWRHQFQHMLLWVIREGRDKQHTFQGWFILNWRSPDFKRRTKTKERQLWATQFCSGWFSHLRCFKSKSSIWQFTALSNCKTRLRLCELVVALVAQADPHILPWSPEVSGPRLTKRSWCLTVDVFITQECLFLSSSASLDSLHLSVRLVKTLWTYERSGLCFIWHR